MCVYISTYYIGTRSSLSRSIVVRHVLDMDMDMEIEPHQNLPDDLVLEIIARSSPATIIRCGAISKPLRRRILHPAFLRRLRVVNAGDDTGNSRCGFVPSLLLGLYRRAKDLCSPLALVPPDTAGAASIATSLALVPPATPINHGANHSACIFGPYLPLSSRRSLIVLRRRCRVIGHQDYLHSGLTVCNPVSGERWVLPPHEVSDETVVLLDVNHNDQAIGTHSFKLLAAQLLVSPARTLIFQVFSSDEREWGTPVACPIYRICLSDGDSNVVVLRGAVYWLCCEYSGYSILSLKRRGDGGEPKASLVNLPESCKSGMHNMCLALSPAAAADDGTSNAALLSVVVHGSDRILVWVRRLRTTARGRSRRWELRHVIRENSIRRPGFSRRMVERKVARAVLRGEWRPRFGGG